MHRPGGVLWANQNPTPHHSGRKSDAARGEIPLGTVTHPSTLVLRRPGTFLSQTPKWHPTLTTPSTWPCIFFPRAVLCPSIRVYLIRSCGSLPINKPGLHLALPLATNLDRGRLPSSCHCLVFSYSCDSPAFSHLNRRVCTSSLPHCFNSNRCLEY